VMYNVARVRCAPDSATLCVPWTTNVARRP
jgi:hypothetical protein